MKPHIIAAKSSQIRDQKYAKRFGTILFIGLLLLFATGFQQSCAPIESIESILASADPSSYDHVNAGDYYVPPSVLAIAIDPRTGNVFVGGHFSTIGNVTAYNIAFYDKGADQWYRLRDRGLVNDASQYPGHVGALAIKGNFLFVGGNFSQTSTETLGSQPVTNLNNIAKYNIGDGMPEDVQRGTWSPLSDDGLSDTVNALVFSGNHLYVGGSFSTAHDESPLLKNVAIYSDATTCTNNCWVSLPDNGLNSTVYALEISHEFPNSVFVGGEFTNTGAGNRPQLSRIARFDGTTWNELYGNGLNGSVKALKEENRQLYIGGGFTSTIGPAALVPTNRLAIYEFPSDFHPWRPAPGSGLSGEVSSIAVKDGVLIAGGTFTQSVNGSTLNLGNIAYGDTVNSSEWAALAGNGLNNSVHALALGEGIAVRDLFIGGSFSGTADGSMPNLQRIARFPLIAGGERANNSRLGITSGEWFELGINNGIALNGPVSSLASDSNGYVYVGGSFLGAENTPNQLNRIARFNPTSRTWSPLGNNGLNGNVEALWRVGNYLYVGGYFTATADGAVTNLNRMARYDLTANTWHAIPNNGLNGVVLSFAQKGNELWVGGMFTRTHDNTVMDLNRLARFNLLTGTWSAVPNNGMNGDVNALAFKGDDLYIGGGFTRTSDNNYFVWYFTKLDTLTGIYYELANSGTNFPVERLRLSGNDMYVSGQFTRTKDNTIILDGLGRYDTVLNGWNAVFGYPEVLLVGRQLNASLDLNNDRYIGGDFHRVGNTVAHYFTRLYGQVWNVSAGTSDWNDGTNWSTGAVPAANTSAVIPSGSGSVNITSSDVVLADLIVNGGTLNIGPGRTLTINGILKLGGGVINGDGTVIVTDCRRDRIMGGSDSSYIRTALVRCVDNDGVYSFPVGSLNAYSPVYVGEISGTGNVSVKANQGEYTGPATGLPTNRLQRWWNVENPGGGVTNSQLIFQYKYVDIISNEPTYKAYRISGGNATVASDVANTYTHRATATNVTAFSDWTIAGDPGGPTPTPTPTPPLSTPTPTPVPSPTPTPTPMPTPTPTPVPTPTPTPTPIEPPTLGAYSNPDVVLSGNTMVPPVVPPTGTASLSATTDSRFRGTLVADPSTGNVRVSNAQPAGVYTITVKAFGPGGTATTFFTLTVTNGTACPYPSSFTDAADIWDAYNPISLSIGDIDNDGDQDLAILNDSAAAVSIMLGDGTGAFIFNNNVSVGFGPVAIDLADLNNDGKLDLVSALNGRLSARLGVGDGTFTNVPLLDLPDFPDSLAVGDMNGDGIRDVILGFSSSAAVRVLIGDGTGTFAIGTAVSVGTDPRKIVIGDVNADGNSDVLTANYGANTVSVRLGDGAGGLSATTEISVGTNPKNLTLGMFDADTILDLATSNYGGASISVRNGDGLGGFSGTTELLSTTFPESIAISDIDNDGVQDIVTGDSGFGTNVVNFGDGVGGFAETLSVTAGGWPISLKVGDLNGDGRQDLVTGNYLGWQTSVRLGACEMPSPTPTPTPEETPTPTPTPTPMGTKIIVSDSSLNVAGYNTLKEAFDAVNAGSHTGNITMSVEDNTTETAMSNLTYSGDGLASYTSITITPSGGAWTISGTMADGEALINLNGADNVVIDGLNASGNTLTLANFSTGGAFGSATIRFENGATSNSIRNTSILGSTSGATTAVVLFHNDLVTTDGNDNNTIEFCNIGPAGRDLPSNSVRSATTNSPITISNSEIAIRNNNIYDFSGNAIFIFPGRFWSITDNRFFQTSVRSGSQRVMYLDGPNPNDTEGLTVTGNVIGYSSSDGTGTYTVTDASRFDGIYIRIRFGGITSNISNNTITAIDVSGPAGVAFYGIFSQQGPLDVSANTIGSINANGAITVTSNTTVTTESIGIANYGGSVTFTANNNQIGGLTFSNSDVGGILFRGIYAGGSTITSFNASGNTIGGTVADSIRTNGFNSVGTPSQVIGIGANCPSSISNNTIQNLTAQDGEGTGANASLIGILTTNTSANHTVSSNIIRGLTNMRTSGNGNVSGIHITGSTANTVERNQIHRLTVATGGTSAEVNGIRAAGGTAAYRNNMIALGSEVTNAIGSGVSTGGVNGINEVGGTNTVYHNSLYIGGSPLAGSGPSYAFKSTQVTASRAYRNNIFYNARSNSGATGENFAVRVGGTAANPAGLTMNNNIYHANGVGGVLGYFNSTNRASLAAWQAAVGQDAASFDADPQFVNPTAATPDLHLSTSLISPAMDTGVSMSVFNDFESHLRPAGGGYDIGGDEALAPSASFVSVSGRILTADGNGIRGVVVDLSVNGEIKRAITGAFGYYTVEDVPVGETCVVFVTSKRYAFAMPMRIVTVTDSISDVDFVAEPLE